MTPPESKASSPSELSALGDRFEEKVKTFKHLPFWPRMAVLTLGWLVILIGIVGLVLPGPGTVALIAGAAILSVASEVAYKGMRSALQRWPAIWTRFEALRDRIHDRVHAYFRREPKP